MCVGVSVSEWNGTQLYKSRPDVGAEEVVERRMARGMLEEEKWRGGGGGDGVVVEW